MDPDTVDARDGAAAARRCPRVVGADAEGNEITAQNGRYGPYLKKGTDSRSLETEDQLFTVTLAEAEAIFAQPKRRPDQRTKPPIASSASTPTPGKPVRVLDGRFGPYVTDGATNATDAAAASTPTRSRSRRRSTCSRERAAKGPAKKAAKKTRRKKAAKKKTAKKSGEEVGDGYHAGREEGDQRRRQEGEGEEGDQRGGTRGARKQ